MKPVLIVRTGRAPEAIRARYGDFPQWFRVAGRLARHRVLTVDVAGGERLPAPRDVAAAIVTGSAAMVTERATWSEQTAGWIRDAMDARLPLLGVCYGHQLMAHALGGRIDYLPGGREIGTIEIERLPAAAGDSLLDGAPIRFRAHATHEQSVLEAPPGARVLARSACDPHHLLRYSANAWSVQFHPEFNADVMRAYIRGRHQTIRAEGSDPLRLYREVAPTPVARGLLRGFGRLPGGLPG